MTGWLFAVIGAITGWAHAASIGHPGRRGAAWSWPAHLLGVGGVLLVGALTGQILPTTAGWAAGLVAGGVVVGRRLA